MVMYSIERNIVKLENKNYKPISDKNRKDIEVHFLKLKEYEYDYVYNSKHFRKWLNHYGLKKNVYYDFPIGNIRNKKII